MAIFNPEVSPGKDNMPSWLKQSSPISAPESDKSTGLALSGLGTGIEGAAGLVQTAANDIVSKDVRSAVEPIREDFTKELELARSAQRSNTDIIPATGGDKTPVPQAIDSGISKVNALQSALANGKINDTYYDLRLKTAVTDLRSKYPGFVDLIDQKVSQITGVNPANAYINNLMQDINQAQNNKKTEYDKNVDLARGAMSDGILPNAFQQYQRLQSDPKYLPQWQQWYGEESAKVGDLRRRDLFRKSSQATKEDMVANRESDWNVEVGAAVSSNLNSMVRLAGINDTKSLSAFIADAANNPGKYNEESMKELATKLLAQQSVLETQLQSRMTQTDKDNTGKSYSYASDIGSDKASAVIKNNIAVFGTMAKALTDGNAGLAFYAANHAKAMLDQTKDNLLSDKDTSAWASKIATFNELFGNNWTSLAISNGLKTNIDDKMRTYFDNKTLDARLGVNSVNMKQHMDEANKLQSDGKITSEMKSRYVGGLVNLVDDIKDPKAPDAAKVNVLKYMFSPEGQGILKGFKTDYTDPETGKFVPGKYAVFQRLTSGDIVSEVARLSKSDPAVGKMYKNYLEREAGAELFQKELLNLNRYTGHDDLHFKYNDGEKGGVPNIELIGADGKPVSITRPRMPGEWGNQNPNQDAAYQRSIQKVVDRVNDGLSGMARVEKGLGGNANDYILRFLQMSQVELGKNWEGLPAKLISAIASSRAPARRIEDTFDDAKRK